MDIIFNNKLKIVEVWVSKNEVLNQDLRAHLVSRYKAKGYLTVFFESGTSELYDSTLILLRHNRSLSADAAND